MKRRILFKILQMRNGELVRGDRFLLKVNRIIKPSGLLHVAYFPQVACNVPDDRGFFGKKLFLQNF